MGGLSLCSNNRLVSFGEYVEDTETSTLQKRDHKYVTDIIIQE